MSKISNIETKKLENLYKKNKLTELEQETKKLLQVENNNIILSSTFNDWDNILKSNDFIISTRVHTTLKCISLNIPVITIAHDSRILELCNKMCIPYIDNLDSLKFCVLSYNTQVKKFNDNIKKYYHDYLNFFIENNIPIKS